MKKLLLVWLTEQETASILDAAKAKSERDHLILTLCRYGLRIGEILGFRRLPGIHVQDLRDNGIWLVGKGYTDEPPSLYPLPRSFMRVLLDYSARKGRGKEAKLFTLSVGHMEKLIKKYAKSAGVQDWKDVRPHRLRAFFATDLENRGYPAFTIRNQMRHKSINTTNRYVGRGTIERRAEIMESLVA